MSTCEKCKMCSVDVKKRIFEYFVIKLRLFIREHVGSKNVTKQQAIDVLRELADTLEKTNEI